MSSARWPHDQVGLSYREKAGSRQPPTLSDGDHVRPASSTPRQELPSLFCPISGILTLEPPCTQTNGEGAADPGRGLTADGDESLLHLSFCSVPQHSAPLPTHHPCMSALPFLPVYFGGWSTAPDPPSPTPCWQHGSILRPVTASRAFPSLLQTACSLPPPTGQKVWGQRALRLCWPLLSPLTARPSVQQSWPSDQPHG